MDFSEAYDDTSTSVGLAARMGEIAILKDLLQRGHTTNGHDNRGWRALHEAAYGGHAECVHLLLRADDVDVDALSHESVTALHLACRDTASHTKVVELLLTAGADPNMRSGDDWVLPLNSAIHWKNVDIVEKLLDAGADVNREDMSNGPPLLYAAELGQFEILELLVKRGAVINNSDGIRRTALHALLQRRGKKDIIPILSYLLDQGADVNARMEDGTTPLMLAVQSYRTDAAMILLNRGADVNIRKENDILALHYAVQFSCEDMDLDSDSDNNADTPLTEPDALLRRILSLTSRELIVPPSTKCVKYSLYHLAVEWDRFSHLKTLVESRLDADKFLQESSSSIVDENDVSLFRQIPTVLHIGTTADTPLAFLLSKPLNRKRVDAAKFMIDAGSSVNAVQPNCVPPLVEAVKHQRDTYGPESIGFEIVEYLLNRGADVMYKIRESDVLPVALYVSSLFNVAAFFRLLQRCVPSHKVFTRSTLVSLSHLYRTLQFYAVYSMFPWRIISWLRVVNMFVKQLPLDTKLLFDQERLVQDDNLTTAWNSLDELIGSPKSLLDLCVLSVREAVGDATSWDDLSKNLKQLSCMNSPLPAVIMDLLNFNMVETDKLYQSPPKSAMLNYLVTLPNSEHSSNDESDSE